MTRDELIAEAAKAFVRNDMCMLKLAEQSLSSEQVASRAAFLSKRRERVNKVFGAASYGIGILLGCLWLVILFNEKRTVAMVILSVIVIAALAVLSSAVLFAVQGTLVDCWAKRREATLLKPIAGTARCEDALRHLEAGGELTRNWRDLAIAERGQLQEFDVAMLDALRYRYESIVEESREKISWDEACRKVHGIAAANQASETAQPM